VYAGDKYLVSAVERCLQRRDRKWHDCDLALAFATS
jgi:hypothetical protein